MSAAIGLGQGASADERKVEAALNAFGLTSPSVSYRRLALGITNLNWLAYDGETTLFIKLYGENTESFINRTASQAASRLAGEVGVGPKLLACVTDPGAEIYEFLDGYRNVSSEEMLRPEIRKALMAGYRRMHDSPLIGETRSAFDQLASRMALARQHDAILPPDLDHLLWQCGRAQAAIMKAGEAMAVCHNDSYAANFMINDAGDLRIIDWEYAANNDPAWDLGMIATGHLSIDQTSELVADYLGHANAAMTARVHLYGAVVCISWCLWAAVQSKVSSIPFDFRKYSKALAQMGRMKLRDPSWEVALWTL